MLAVLAAPQEGATAGVACALIVPKCTAALQAGLLLGCALVVGRLLVHSRASVLRHNWRRLLNVGSSWRRLPKASHADGKALHSPRPRSPLALAGPPGVACTHACAAHIGVNQEEEPDWGASSGREGLECCAQAVDKCHRGALPCRLLPSLAGCCAWPPSGGGGRRD